MCGIAGIIDLTQSRPVPNEALHRMARAIIHRGPDEEGFHLGPHVGFGSRRLSIVGLADGQQPVSNEDGTISVVFNGELFDHLEKRAELQARGHKLAKSCDTEVIPHLWEEHQQGMWERLRGQFAIALWDERRRTLSLGRDRFGICPLYWTVQDNWLLFCSEIKGILASAMVKARPDRRGINNIFSFTALPAPTTCFEGIQLLTPGHFLEIEFGREGSAPPEIVDHTYWQMDFPDRGDEEMGDDPKKLVDDFEKVLLQAVDMRLKADVPVGSYLSGGVDSSMIAALAVHLKGSAINTYTVRVDSPELDELDAANLVARHIQTKPPVVQEFTTADSVNTYPELLRAAESPVVDTSCAALLLLARKVHQCGQKVVLTGEGADEWLVGYPWYKAAKILSFFDILPGVRVSDFIRRGYLAHKKVPQFPAQSRRDAEASVGGPNAWIDAYGMLALSKLRFFSESMLADSEKFRPWDDLKMPLERARRWHPLNRGIWVAGRVTLAGMLLQAKGDRVAMNSSVEVRYPFLDENVFNFLAKVHPKWKLNGFRDKRLLRLLAERWVPKSVYSRGKVIFRAPLDSFHLDPEPAYVSELLSEDSLKRTGYFDYAAVRQWRTALRDMPQGLPRLSVEGGLAAVVATQLWHHIYIDQSLSQLPVPALC